MLMLLNEFRQSDHDRVAEQARVIADQDRQLDEEGNEIALHRRQIAVMTQTQKEMDAQQTAIESLKSRLGGTGEGGG